MSEIQDAAAPPQRVHLSEFTHAEAAALTAAACTLNCSDRELVDELARVGYKTLLRRVSEARLEGYVVNPTVQVLAGALQGAGLES